MNSKMTIDQDLCISCGRCVKECGNHIKIQNGNHVDHDNPKCSKCFHCYTVCPKNAIKLDNDDNVISFNQGLFDSINEENLTHFLAYRRSIRSYENIDVDNSIIEKLVERARYIPSGGNAHSYEFTVVKTNEVRSLIMSELTKIYRLRSLILNNSFLRNAAKPFVNKLMRGFLSDKNYGSRMKDLLQRIESGEDPFFYHAPVIIIIHSRDQIPTPKEDCILAGYNICLTAQSLGLGTCFVTLAQNAFNSSASCKSILGLSPEDNVNAVVVLGYPKTHHKRIAPKQEKQIHWC